MSIYLEFSRSFLLTTLRVDGFNTTSNLNTNIVNIIIK